MRLDEKHKQYINLYMWMAYGQSGVKRNMATS